MAISAVCCKVMSKWITITCCNYTASVCIDVSIVLLTEGSYTVEVLCMLYLALTWINHSVILSALRILSVNTSERRFYLRRPFVNNFNNGVYNTRQHHTVIVSISILLVTVTWWIKNHHYKLSNHSVSGYHGLYELLHYQRQSPDGRL